MTKKRNETKKWIYSGTVIAFIVSILFVSSYQFFFKRSQSFSDAINPYESDENINWIYNSSYMLYRDLYMKVHNEDISYEELYFPSKNSDADVWEEIDKDSVSTDDEGFIYLKEQLDSYFANMEDSFHQLNICYDYLMEDLESGESISNMPNQNILPQEQYFYLEFLFDQNGNVTLGEEIWGEDAVSIRKYASAAIHENTLYNLLQKQLETDNSFLTDFSQKCSLNPPRNCRLVYCISQNSMARFRQEGVYYYYNTQSDDGEVDAVYYMNRDWYGFIDAGIGIFLVVLLLIVFLLPIVFPRCVVNSSCEKTVWEEHKLLRIPFELLLILTVIISGAIGDALIILGYQTSDGTLKNALTTYLGIGSATASDFLAYLINIV